jgi:hypothetical protein
MVEASDVMQYDSPSHAPDHRPDDGNDNVVRAANDRGRELALSSSDRCLPREAKDLQRQTAIASLELALCFMTMLRVAEAGIECALDITRFGNPAGSMLAGPQQHCCGSQQEGPSGATLALPPEE